MGQSGGVPASASAWRFPSSETGAEQVEEDYEVDLLADASVEKIHNLLCNPHELETYQKPPPVRLKDANGRDLPIFHSGGLPQQAVILNVYDLSDDFQDANDMLSFGFEDLKLGGAFHAGVEVVGTEWAYGFCGVVCGAPRIAADHIYRCGVKVGETTLSRHQLAFVLQEFCHTWRGGDYDLLGRNCCSFSTALLAKLGVGPMPAWVDRLARVLHQGRAAGLAAGQGAVQAGLGAGQALFGPFGDKRQANRRAADTQGCNGPKVDGKAVNWSLWEQSVTEFHVGAAVEYFSASKGMWIPAKVLSVNQAKGTYDLDCKPQVVPSNIRWPGGERPDGATFQVGSVVEYNSASQGKWVCAKVLAYDMSTGLYDLDCKKQVARDRIRAK
mmetsp:Transcript_31532/g.57956  ORF Transcript_31532/g.57956 Transcript_31532/m.57956 type:complete len:385 (-) Transcript_31532:97-1251(-)